MTVFARNFKKVLKNHKPTDVTVIHDIELREIMKELDSAPNWKEFMHAVTELTNDKAPELNRVPPNAFKAMDATNLRHHFNFTTDFWEGNVDVEEWHEGQVVPVPKSSNLSDPNKWQGVNLVDIGEIFSAACCVKDCSK